MPAGETLHYRFDEALATIESGVPTLLIGPQGSGKSTLCRQLATATGRRFTFHSMSAGVTENKLFGQLLPQPDGSWSFFPTSLVNAYKSGGLHLMDEIDASDPNVLIAFNAAIANGHLYIPGSGLDEIERSPDFRIVAAANTYGDGADMRFVGRSAQDAAVMDRYKVGRILIDYDRKVEESIVTRMLADHDGLGSAPARKLLDYGWAFRDKCREFKLEHEFTTRNFEDAAKVLRKGITFPQIAERTKLGLSDEDQAILADVTLSA